MDRTLIERAQAGDHEAFAMLAKGSIDRLYASASLILHDGDRARDAVQEGLVAAWRGIIALRDPDAWEAWVHRLVVRACYRLARRERRLRVVDLELAEDVEAPPDAAAGLLEERDELERGFRRLAVDQRAILVLHHYAGMPLGEVAQVLGIPVGTAKSRLHRATQAMRAALDADAREPVGVGKERLA